MFFRKNVVNIFKKHMVRSIVFFLTDESSLRSIFLFEGQNDQHVILSLFMTKMENEIKDYI